MTKFNGVIGGALVAALLLSTPAAASADLDAAKFDAQSRLTAAIASVERAAGPSARELVAALRDARDQVSEAASQDEIRSVVAMAERIERNAAAVAQEEAARAPCEVDVDQDGNCDGTEDEANDGDDTGAGEANDASLAGIGGGGEGGEGGGGEGGEGVGGDSGEQNTMFDEVVPGGGGGPSAGGGGFEGDPLASGSLVDSAGGSEGSVLGGGGGNDAFGDVDPGTAPSGDNTASTGGGNIVKDPVREDPVIVSGTGRPAGG